MAPREVVGQLRTVFRLVRSLIYAFAAMLTISSQAELADELVPPSRLPVSTDKVLGELLDSAVVAPNQDTEVVVTLARCEISVAYTFVGNIPCLDVAPRIAVRTDTIGLRDLLFNDSRSPFATETDGAGGLIWANWLLNPKAFLSSTKINDAVSGAPPSPEYKSYTPRGSATTAEIVGPMILKEGIGTFTTNRMCNGSVHVYVGRPISIPFKPDMYEDAVEYIRQYAALNCI